MEQLSRREIDGLISRSRTVLPAAPGPAPGPAPGLPTLWARRAAPDPPGAATRHDNGAHAALLAEAPFGQQAVGRDLAPGLSPGEVTPMAGVERRLARRAEALWETLRGPAALPPAAASAVFLAPPFAAHALLFQLSPQAAGRAHERLRVAFVGEAVQSLDIVSPGVIVPDNTPTAPLGPRLAAVAALAIATASPAVFDSDPAVGHALVKARAPMLMRAMALPLAAGDCAEPSAIVIASWRALLSADETVALHRELAAAIDWMHHHKPQD